MSDAPPPPSGALRLGAVAGVPVYLDRTWLLLAAFVAWSGWTSGRDLGTGTALAYAGWLVVAILLAVLAHEAAHAVCARLLGFRVHAIVATLWGGHTSYDGSGTTPGRHAAVALSGPAANGLLALGGLLAARLLPYPVSEFAFSFLVMNALLAVFNLLPGLPLDGGAAVQSLVWGVSGRRDLGLVVAGWVGRLLAVALVLLFVVRPVAAGEPDLVSVLLALVMGWILWTGASAAIRRAPLERLAHGTRVGRVAAAVLLAPAGMTLGEALARPEVVIGDDERGRPVLLLAGAGPDLPHQAPVSAAFTRLPDEALVEADPADDLRGVLGAFGATGGSHVVLTRGGRPWGVVTASALEAAARGLLGRN